MKSYVLRFIFDLNLEKILWMKKNRPDFQKGKLNGLGGSIELNEYPLDAIRREIKEECGLDIEQWVNFGKLLDHVNGHNIELFYTVTNEIYNFKQMEDEEVKIYDLDEYLADTSDNYYDRLGYPNKTCYKNFNRMRNIDWMITMALNHYSGADKTRYFEIKERE